MDIGECVFKSWPNGAYFGEIEIIFDKRRICSAKAAPDTDCDLFTLSKKLYETLLRHDYPDLNRELKKTALERENRIVRSLKKATEVLQAIGIDEACMETPNVAESVDNKSSIYRRVQSLGS